MEPPPIGHHCREARRAFEAALAIDPRSIEAKIGIARILLVSWIGNFDIGSGYSVQQDSARAEQLLIEAIEGHPNNWMARATMGQLCRLQNRLSESQIEFETAIALGANDEYTYGQLAWALVLSGQPNAGLAQGERTLRLSPRDPNLWGTYLVLGWCHSLLDEADPAIELLIKSRAANPRSWVTHFALAGALGLKGDINGAEMAMAASLAIKPDVNSLARFRTYRPWGNA